MSRVLSARRSDYSKTAHGLCDSPSNPFCACLDFAVPDMGVAQCHDRLRMSKHPSHGRQGNALRHGLARYGMAKVMQAYILDPCLPPRPAPETEITGLRPCRVSRRGKDEVAPRPRLSGDDGLRRLAEPDGTRPRLGLGEPEHVAIDLGPSERQDFALPAAGQQKQTDDVGLRSARGPFFHEPLQGPVKPGDLLR